VLGASFFIFILNLVSGFVALLTSYYAWRFNRLIRTPLLTAISIGFMLLGIGLVVDGLTSAVYNGTLVDIIGLRVLAVVETLSYLTIQVLAYFVFAVGYGLVAYGKSAEKALPLTFVGLPALELYRYALASYFLAMVLLGFIVFQGFLIHSRTKSQFSLLVLSAFSLILVAHLILFISVLTLGVGLFLFGTGVQFLGFVSLFAFILRSGRVGAG